jgi:hypothetical protein
MFYIITIAVSIIIIIVLNYFISTQIFGFGIWFIIACTLITALAIFALDALVAYLINKFAKKKVNITAKYFIVSRKEKMFWQKLGVKKYKASLPDLGKLGDFPKNKIQKPNDKEYIKQYILESCAGEVNHLISMFIGIVVIFIFPLKYILCFGIPVFIVNFVLNLLPIAALRYNRFLLNNLYIRLNRITETHQD